MNPKKQPCIAVAFAQACNEPLASFIQRLDARGGLVKGTYHHQQCIDVAWSLGFASLSIEAAPTLVATLNPREKPEKVIFPEGRQSRFDTYLRGWSGVLGGLIYPPKGSPIGHAVSWKHPLITDPRGFSYTISDGTKKPHYFYANNFIALIKVNTDE